MLLRRLPVTLGFLDLQDLNLEGQALSGERMVHIERDFLAVNIEDGNGELLAVVACQPDAVADLDVLQWNVLDGNDLNQIVEVLAVGAVLVDSERLLLPFRHLENLLLETGDGQIEPRLELHRLCGLGIATYLANVLMLIAFVAAGGWDSRPALGAAETACAASVIAMAGDEVLMSPVSMLMIHNPSTVAAGERRDMEQAINMLDAVKNSIIEAYRKKTGISEKALSDMMNDETWMNANMAIKKHFADGYIGEKSPAENAVMFARVPFMKKVTAQIGTQNKAIPADELYSRLHKLKSNF